MPNLAIVPPAESAEIKRIKAQAQKHYEAIVKAGAMESTCSMRIGYHAYRLKIGNMFGVLGFEDEAAAQEASGVGQSTWYANKSLAEKFKDVPEEMFVKMKQANAKALADMPDSKRGDSMWLRMAETMSMKDFKAKVDVEMMGKARESDGKERPAKLDYSMPTSRKLAVESMVKEYAKSIGVEDPGKALEIMATESTGGKSLVEAINNAVQHIKSAKATMHSGLSLDEVVVKIEATLDEMVLGFQAALDQASQKQDAAA